ncbi:unnamed protein product [Polarella glacialis]|uniref:C3H1-type domain-containing protein n=1 Tax=Polarella glacialis TaxID=89957 RepID=A0A813EBH5_POLGL|nr:unnamed protein product [Polarella glacialis]
MATSPTWTAGRPRRSGAARRAQQVRARGRAIQCILGAMDELALHRGCQPSRLGAAPAHILRGSAVPKSSPDATPSKPCKHFVRGFCRRGQDCGFLHQAPEAQEGTIHGAQTSPHVPTAASPSEDLQALMERLKWGRLHASETPAVPPAAAAPVVAERRSTMDLAASNVLSPYALSAGSGDSAICTAAASGFTPQSASASSLQNQGLEFVFNVHAPTFQPIPLLHSDAADVSDSEDGPSGQFTRDARTSGASVQTFAGTLAPRAVAHSSTPGGVHTQLGPGSRVQVQGLQNRQEMNGQFGQLMHFDEAKMRWAVELECGTKVLLKPGNLLPRAKEPSHYSIDDSSSEGSAESEFWGWPAGAGEEGADMAKEIVESVQVPVARSASSDKVRRMTLGETNEYLQYISETVGGDTFVQYVEKRCYWQAGVQGELQLARGLASCKGPCHRNPGCSPRRFAHSQCKTWDAMMSCEAEIS